MADQRLRNWLARLWVAGVALLLVAFALGWTMSEHDPRADAIAPIRDVQRIGRDGASQPVRLPDEVLAPPGDTTPVAARYRWQADLGEHPARLALYASGLLGAARLRVNDQPVFDEIGDAGSALPARPRGAAALRLVELPAVLLRPGRNDFELDVAGRGWISLSPIRLGDHEVLRAMQARKAAALVTGPAVVATAIGCTGLAMLLLWLRQPDERQYGYFGIGAALWAMHTLWTVSPGALLRGVHLGVWWNTLYAAVVIMLVLFALRFAQRLPRPVEIALLAALAATPGLLYGASALGWLVPASEALRLALVALAFGGLAVVARFAWHRRSLASAMFVLAGAASAGLGLRDWLVFRAGDDNFPVPLTPYAGAPFVLLVSWVLIDGFVRTAQSLASVNSDLERRVAEREAELGDYYQRTTQLEREQAAGDERQRILRELHDGLGAKLLNSMTRVEQSELDGAGLARELRDCLADMRLATEALAPGQTDLAAVVGNLLFRWERLLRDAGVRPLWQLDLREPGPAIEPYVALQLLRVMQQALSNALRHAEARQVRVAIGVDDGAIRLVIEDDGRGIDPHALSPRRGLDDMQARAGAIGAQLTLSTPPGGGTRVELMLALRAT